MSNRLRIGVIGAGHWGPNLIRCFQESPESEVAMLCDANPERLKALQSSYPKVTTTEQWKDVCLSTKVDAVVVATPTSSHYSIVREALLNGKHVFVEKPLCTDSKAGQELVELAESKKLKLFVGHVFLFNPGVQYLRRLIAAGELGDVLYLSATRTNLGPIRYDVNALWDLAVHDISIFLYLMGSFPTELTAFGSSYINPPLEDVVFAGLKFPKNVMAALHCSWLDPKKVRQLLVVGSQKMAVFDDMSPDEPVRVYDKNVAPSISESTIGDTIYSFRKSIIEGPSYAPKISYVPPLKTEVEAFLSWVLHDLPTPSTPELSLAVVEILEKLSDCLAPKKVHLETRPLHNFSGISP